MHVVNLMDLPFSFYSARLRLSLLLLASCLASSAFAAGPVPARVVVVEAPAETPLPKGSELSRVQPATAIVNPPRVERQSLAKLIPSKPIAAVNKTPAVLASVDELPTVPPDAMEDFEAVQVEAAAAEERAPEYRLANATKMRMFDWREEDHYRAGCPQELRHFTMLSSNNRYTAYRVGGGSPFIGTGPTLYEGTWGLDYEGFFPKKVALNWNRGRRYQGGTEGYKTDGPKHGE